ncbi:MAG: hypothetical protein S4CHLAM20_12220 [Chlamydiia bacterium]|nr:hypothetical protein [Chlamydiia bacterium]
MSTRSIAESPSTAQAYESVEAPQPSKITALAKETRDSAEKVTQVTQQVTSKQTTSIRGDEILEKLKGLNGNDNNFAYFPIFRCFVEWDAKETDEFWQNLYETEKLRRDTEVHNEYICLDRSLNPLSQIVESNENIFLGALLFGNDKVIVFASVTTEQAIEIHNNEEKPLPMQYEASTNLLYSTQFTFKPRQYQVCIEDCIRLQAADPQRGNLIFSAVGKTEFATEPLATIFILMASIVHKEKPYYSFMGFDEWQFKKLQLGAEGSTLPVLQHVYEWDSQAEEVRQILFSSGIKRYGDTCSFKEFQQKCQMPNAFASEEKRDLSIYEGSKVTNPSRSQESEKSNPVFIMNENLFYGLNNPSMKYIRSKRPAIEAYIDQLDLSQSEAIYVNRDFEITDWTNWNKQKKARFKRYPIGSVIVDLNKIPVYVLINKKKKIENLIADPSPYRVFTTIEEIDVNAASNRVDPLCLGTLTICYILELLTQYLGISISECRICLKKIALHAKEEDQSSKAFLISEKFQAIEGISQVDESMVQVGCLEINGRDIEIWKKVSEEEVKFLSQCPGFSLSKKRTLDDVRSSSITLKIAAHSTQIFGSMPQDERQKFWMRVSDFLKKSFQNTGPYLLVSEDYMELSEEWDQKASICILGSICSPDNRVTVIKKMSEKEVKKIPHLIANNLYQNNEFPPDFGLHRSTPNSAPLIPNRGGGGQPTTLTMLQIKREAEFAKATEERNRRLKLIAKRKAQPTVRPVKDDKASSESKALDDEALYALFEDKKQTKSDLQGPKEQPKLSAAQKARKKREKREKEELRQKRKQRILEEERKEIAKQQRAKALADNQAKAELEKIARNKALQEAKRKAAEEAERRAAMEAERKAAEEAKRRAAMEAERKAEEARLKATAEGEQKVAEVAQRSEPTPTEDLSEVVESATEVAKSRSQIIAERVKILDQAINNLGEPALNNINAIIDLERRKTVYKYIGERKWDIPESNAFEYEESYKLVLLDDIDLKARISILNKTRIDLLRARSKVELENLDLGSDQGRQRFYELDVFIWGLDNLEKYGMNMLDLRVHKNLELNNLLDWVRLKKDFSIDD